MILKFLKLFRKLFFIENDLECDINNCSKDILWADVIMKLYSYSNPYFINFGIILNLLLL